MADFLWEEMAGSLTLGELWDSLGYGWTRDFVDDELGLSQAQVNAYVVRLGQLSLGNLIAL